MTRDSFTSETEGLAAGAFPGDPEAESPRLNVMGMTRDQLREWVASWGQPPYRADQLFQWIYHKRITEFSEMTNLPKTLRAEFAARACIGRLKLAARVASAVDDTVKYLYELEDGEKVESVLMHDQNRVTVCVSSQVGCAQGCAFCATAQVGLKRNMTVGEIVCQLVQIEQEIGPGSITNLVLMGMGEPLANYRNVVEALKILSASEGFCLAARKIIVSTSGLVPAIERFTRETLKVGLALSLNATTDEMRNRLIPSIRRYTLAKVLEVCKQWTRVTGRRLTIEYVLLHEVNDSPEDARRLVHLLKTIPSKVNLIPFNPVDDSGFARPTDEAVTTFQHIVREAHIVTTVRATKGQDIAAACGQLRAEYSRNSIPTLPFRSRTGPCDGANGTN